MWFPKSNRPIPYDIVLRHSEWYEYPDKESPGHTKKSYKEWNGYYHLDPECIKQHHPHFHSGLLRVDPEVKEKLSKVNFDYLKLHFHVNLQWWWSQAKELNIVKFTEVLEKLVILFFVAR